MPASRQTSHYDLSQFAETDRPTWSGDYNTDMAKIDEAIYNAANAQGPADVWGSAAKPYIHDSGPIDLDNILDDGFHAFRTGNEVIGHSPHLGSFERALMLVSNCGYDSGQGVRIQLWINRGVGQGNFFMAGRTYADNRWGQWTYLATRSEVQAIENRIAALETKLAATSSPTLGLTAKQYDESYANNSNIIIAGPK